MKDVSIIGLDIAKSVFQVYGVDQAGEVVVSKQLRRRQMIPFFEKLPTCLIGMEACATSHHWARELGALAREVRILPAGYPRVREQPGPIPDERDHHLNLGHKDCGRVFLLPILLASRLAISKSSCQSNLNPVVISHCRLPPRLRGCVSRRRVKSILASGKPS